MTLSVLTSLLAGGASAAPTTPPVPNWKKVDGVESLLVEKHDTPIVTIAITFPTGAYFDPPGKGGVASLFGEVLVRGTKKRTREQIENDLDFLGASLDVDTGYHSFQISGRALRRNLDKLTALMLEIMTEPTFPEDEIEKARRETIAHLQLRLEDDAQLASVRYREAIFQGHPYSQEIVGTVASLNSIQKKDLQDFFTSHLHRGGMLVGASGDIDAKTLEGFVRQLNSKLPIKEETPRVIPFQGKADHRKVILVDKPDRSQTQFFIGLPGINAIDPDYFPLRVFFQAFGGGMFQAQYMQEIRVKRGWSYGAGASVDVRRDGGSLTLHTYPAVKDTIPALKLSVELLDKAINGNGLTDQQIEFAKTNLIRSYPFMIDTPDKIMAQKIMDRLLMRPDNYIETIVSKIKAVTVAEARAAASRHVNMNDLLFVMLCTAKDFRETIGKELGAKSVEVVPYDKM